MHFKLIDQGKIKFSVPSNFMVSVCVKPFFFNFKNTFMDYRRAATGQDRFIINSCMLPEKNILTYHEEPWISSTVMGFKGL